LLGKREKSITRASAKNHCQQFWTSRHMLSPAPIVIWDYVGRIDGKSQSYQERGKHQYAEGDDDATVLPAASCAIFTPTLAPMRVAPASTILRASSSPFTPPDALTPRSAPTVFRINALIATLAMSFIVSGCASLVTKGNLLVLFDKPGFGKLARTEWFTIKTSIWLMIVFVVAIGLLLACSTAGRYMYAAGGNAQAARLAGIRVDRVRILAFVLSGGAAGLAGVIDTSRVLSAQASSGDTGLAFTVLAGIVVGGTSILGGVGAVWRTVIGVLFIALIGNGYILLGLDPLYEQITMGVILLAAVGLYAWTSRSA